MSEEKNENAYRTVTNVHSKKIISSTERNSIFFNLQTRSTCHSVVQEDGTPITEIRVVALLKMVSIR